MQRKWLHALMGNAPSGLLDVRGKTRKNSNRSCSFFHVHSPDISPRTSYEILGNATWNRNRILPECTYSGVECAVFPFHNQISRKKQPRTMIRS